MIRLFIGFVFLLFDCNISIDNLIISLTPDFIGYFFIIMGVKELWDKAPRTNALRLFCTIMIVVGLIDFTLHLLGITQFLIPIHLILLVPKVVVCYFVLRLMERTEKAYDITLSTAQMRHLLYGYTACYAFMLVLMLCPSVSNTAFILQLFSIGVGLMILFTFGGAIKEYRTVVRQSANRKKSRSE